MKDIDPKNPPEVPGGYSPGDGGCFPPFPFPGDYPPNPIGPYPQPIIRPAEPPPVESLK